MKSSLHDCCYVTNISVVKTAVQECAGYGTCLLLLQLDVSAGMEAPGLKLLCMLPGNADGSESAPMIWPAATPMNTAFNLMSSLGSGMIDLVAFSWLILRVAIKLRLFQANA